MTANEYIRKLIETIPEYTLSDSDKKAIKLEGIEKFILTKLCSSKFKASSIPEELLIKIKAKIAKSVAESKPIHITIPFGGYKKWQLPSYPSPDWAEVFNFLLLREYLAPIAAAYPKGVLLNYYSDELFIARMNNYPQEDVDIYNQQLKVMFEDLSKYLPNNFNVKYSKIRDDISQEKILKRFDTIIVDLKAKWNTLPESDKKFRLDKSERNYKGDLSGLSKEDKYEILLNSTMVHDAFIFGDWDYDTPWAFGENMIALGFRYTGSWGIHIRSSKASTVQFWIGIGALNKTENDYIPNILTYKQYLESQSRLAYEEIDFFGNKYKNLQTIPVLSL